MSLKDFKAREYLLNNVELNYAQNLTKAVSPFGTAQYELQVATGNPATADEWKANHLPVKTEKYVNKDGEWFAVKNNGELKAIKASSIFPSDTSEFTKYVVSLKRKAKRADQTDNGAPNVFEANAERMSNERAAKIGNGSIGNVIVYQMYYSTAGREGISNSLTSLQVANYVERTESTSFTDLTGGAPAEASTSGFAPIAPVDTVAPAAPF